MSVCAVVGVRTLTKTLDNLDKLAVLGQVDNNNGVDLTSICRVAEEPKSSKECSDDEHDSREDGREFVWLPHGFGDGDDPKLLYE